MRAGISSSSVSPWLDRLNENSVVRRIFDKGYESGNWEATPEDIQQLRDELAQTMQGAEQTADEAIKLSERLGILRRLKLFIPPLFRGTLTTLLEEDSKQAFAVPQTARPQKGDKRHGLSDRDRQLSGGSRPTTPWQRRALSGSSNDTSPRSSDGVIEVPEDRARPLSAGSPWLWSSDGLIEVPEDRARSLSADSHPTKPWQRRALSESSRETSPRSSGGVILVPEAECAEAPLVAPGESATPGTVAPIELLNHAVSISAQACGAAHIKDAGTRAGAATGVGDTEVPARDSTDQVACAEEIRAADAPAAASAPAEVPAAVVTEIHLENLVNEGSDLLQKLEPGLAEEIVSARIQSRPPSPVSRMLIDAGVPVREDASTVERRIIRPGRENAAGSSPLGSLVNRRFRSARTFNHEPKFHAESPKFASKRKYESERALKDGGDTRFQREQGQRRGTHDREIEKDLSSMLDWGSLEETRDSTGRQEPDDSDAVQAGLESKSVVAPEKHEGGAEEDERKALEEAEAIAREAQEQAERQALEAAAKEEEAEQQALEAAAKEEEEKMVRQEAEEAERNALEEAEETAREAQEDAERQALETAAKEEAERRACQDAAEAERKALEEAERKAREAREEAERQALEAAAKEEAERKAREAREEAERQARKAAAKEQAERRAREETEEAERQAHEEAERKAREAREEAERQALKAAAKEEAERRAREEAEEAERQALEEAERMKESEEQRAEAELQRQCTAAIEYCISKLENVERKERDVREREQAQRRAEQAQEATAAMDIVHAKVGQGDFEGAWEALTIATVQWEHVGEDKKFELTELGRLIKREESKLWAAATLQAWAWCCLAMMRTRRKLVAIHTSNTRALAAACIQNNVRMHFALLEFRFMSRLQLSGRDEAAKKIQAKQRSIVARERTKLERIGRTNHRNLVVLQKAYRCHLARQLLLMKTHARFRDQASERACLIQTNVRQHLARNLMTRVKKAMSMMQQWVARYSWKIAIDCLTNIAAEEWRTICAHMAEVHGRKYAFSKAQILAPAVLPSWYLSHFPLNITHRVDLKTDPLLGLENQIRRDRINTLGGIGDFQETLNKLASLVDELTGAARVQALDMSASYNLLVSLIVFCNIHGTDMVSERNFMVPKQEASLEKFRMVGIELLRYAQRLCDGPDFAVSGLTEKLEYQQWTLNNLTRVHFMLGDYEKAAECSRMIETIKTGDQRRDNLVAIISLLHVALVQSKLGKHNTAISTLQKTSDRLVTWCSGNRQRSWPSFCNTRILTKRYVSNAAHLAGVCHYNLAIEYAAVERTGEALEAGKRAWALANMDANSEPIFLRRCKRTIFALETITREKSGGKRPLPAILKRLMQGNSNLAPQQASEDSRASTASSSIRSKVQTIKDAREPSTAPECTRDPSEELSRIKFGTWFPPHVALRLRPQPPGELVDESHDTLISQTGSDEFEHKSAPSILLRISANATDHVTMASTTNDATQDSLVLFAFPMQDTEFEILHAESLALQHTVIHSSKMEGFRAVQRAAALCTRPADKLETLASVSMRQRMIGLVIICIQSASLVLVQDCNGRPSSTSVDWALKYVTLAESLLLSGAFDFQHFVEMKAYARLVRSLCYSAQGHDDKAVRVLSEIVVELALENRPEVHAVVLLNMSIFMAKLRSHRQAFEICEAAWLILRAKTGQKNDDDW
jgi:hypothetical protein